MRGGREEGCCQKERNRWGALGVPSPSLITGVNMLQRNSQFVCFCLVHGLRKCVIMISAPVRKIYSPSVGMYKLPNYYIFRCNRSWHVTCHWIPAGWCIVLPSYKMLWNVSFLKTDPLAYDLYFYAVKTMCYVQKVPYSYQPTEHYHLKLGR